MKNPNFSEQESNLDLYKKLLKKLFKNWHLIGLSLFIALIIGYLIKKSSSPKFENKVTMLITDNSDRRNRFTNETMRMQEMFDLSIAIEDELGIITSFPVLEKTTQELNVDVSYYIKEGLTKKNIYKSAPITVLFDKTIAQPSGVYFELDFISNNRFKLKCNSEDEIMLYNFESNNIAGEIKSINLNKEFAFGEEILINNSKFKIILNGNYSPDNFIGKTLYFRFNNLEELTFFNQASLEVERQSLESSLVVISFKGENPILVTDFLNKLTEVYLGRNLDKKNSIADKTIEFIDEQITEIADTLGITAGQLQDFRSKHNVMDINFLSQTVYEQMRELENQRAVLLVKSKYYDYIKDYFESNQDLTDLLAPSAMGVDDPQLTSLINQLTTVNAARALILDNKSYKHPNLPNLNAEINNLKKTILENIDYIVNTSNITINDINKRIAALENKVKNLPTIEKELINIEREFHINDAIYTLLLETRAEAEIARASNSPDYEVIEPGKYSSVQQVAPKSKIIYLGSIFIGLLIPISIILLISSLDERITDKKDMEKITSYPNVGSIAKSELKTMLPLLEYPKSIVSESFRSARTSLQFFHKGQPKQKILITSSMAEDGKTFSALNLAAAFSYYGKKTLLIEFDLRNPKIADYIGLEKVKGLSSYLVNDARLEDIIQKTEMKNLDVIQAGLTPPNPVELIASDNTKNLIEILQSIYEYIIIDSPPVGIVTDSFLLMDHSDANIFVVRLNHTNKKLFASLIKDFEQKEIPNVAILVNDDEEKIHSSYYDEEGSKLSFIKKKLNTLKYLVRSKKAKAV